jgi:uncharacterized membrane protein/thiol-disulfide isomerase/thioredoxin
MQKDKNITLAILGGLMITTSAYLTYHFYHLQATNSAPSLCHISSFLNCDTAATSQLSNIAGVPISFFGVITGILTILLALFWNSSKEFIKQIHTIILLNAVGCLVLGIYSLIILHSLCPFCTLYYLFSWAAAFITFKKFKLPVFNPLILAQLLSPYAITFLIILVLSVPSTTTTTASNPDIKSQLYKQFLSYEKLPAPTMLSPLQLIKSNRAFKDNKLQILLFSDFQCPACRSIVPTVDAIVKKYKDNISFLYYPYPLDQNCHPQIHRPFHPFACKAAYIAYCLKDDFYTVHDELYAHQRDFSDEWLDNFAREKGVTTCVNDPRTKEDIVKFINFADKTYGINATPTMIINGVKIERGYPQNLLLELLDEILKH